MNECGGRVRVLGVETQACGEGIMYDGAVVAVAVAESIHTQLGPIIQMLDWGGLPR
jgi:hypothetical protein